ncbi:hypothetical protein CES85_3990 [Ochrobactrum quorumnocens]|uniref:Uncharacterized protein n=1 Tax=Ochrobactrum quorumnocens TaxID=271865 RepID=A0A248U9X3_9HYPH|nr:hypothetical protein [[Ochrobactrum] quorumnocens]ASV83211.1 hypothetical protein CES85_3990 [[Ochrobactrum] quorumnocens]
MNDLVGVFSSGVSHLFTFSVGAGAAIIGVSLATRAIEYVKSFIGMSDPFSYVSNIDGVEYGEFGDFSIKYGGLYFESEADLNDHLLEKRANLDFDSNTDLGDDFEDGWDWAEK